MTFKLRRFLVGMLVAGLCVEPVFARSSVDTLISGGIVYNMPPDTVIGISDGKISYLGEGKGARALLTDTTTHIDAKGASIYPGFIDLHTHLFDTIGFDNVSCELNIKTSERTEDACQLRAEELQPGEWLVGFAEGLLTADLGDITPRTWLDARFPHTPAVICEPHSSIIWMNSVALQRMKINKHSVDPIGAKILRTPQKLASGVVLGSLSEMVLEEALRTHDLDMNNVLDRFETLALDLQKSGITSIGESGGFWNHGGLQFWQKVAQDYNLGFRVSVRPRLSPFKGVNDQLVQLTSMYRNDLNDLFLLNQVKINVDGQYRLGTARLTQPYDKATVPSEPNGLFYFTPTELNTWLTRLEEVNFGAYIHAEGDAAVEAALYSIQNARRKGDDQRFTITGMQFIKPVQYPLFSEMGVTVNFLFNAVKNADLAHDQLNHAKVVSIKSLDHFATSIALSSGGFGDHYTPPLKRIAENLQQPTKYRVKDIHKAIEAYTIEPAKSLGIESVTGSLVIGKSADLVFIDNDLTQISADQIAKSTVLMTMLQGGITYQHEKALPMTSVSNSMF